MSFRFVSSMCLLTLVGCLEVAPEVDQVVSEMTLGELNDMGATCYYKEGDMTSKECYVCSYDTYCRSAMRCSTYLCQYGSCVRTDNHCLFEDYGGGLNYWFEAEDARRYAPMVAGGSVNASGGGYVTVPRTAGAAANLRYNLSVEHDDQLFAWARVQVTTPVGPNDTWISMDNGEGWSVQLPTTGNDWVWVPLDDVATGERSTFTTAAGDHLFRIYSNATGVRIDRVLLTHSLGFIPSTEFYEAEAMSVSGSMAKVVPNATTWTNPGYIWVPNGAAGDGYAQKEILLSQPGKYSLWGRVKAPTGADNSFSVITDFGTPVTWSTPVTGTAWAWNQMMDFSGTKPALFDRVGSYTTLEFFRREDGTKLDRYLLSNDPGFRPADAPLVNAAP